MTEPKDGKKEERERIFLLLPKAQMLDCKIKLWMDNYKALEKATIEGRFKIEEDVPLGGAGGPIADIVTWSGNPLIVGYLYKDAPKVLEIAFM